MNGRRLPLVVLAAALVVGALVDVVAGGALFPGYSALLGLVGTAIVTAFAKGIGRAVQRGEGTLGEDAVPDVQPDLVGDPDLRATLRAELGLPLGDDAGRTGERRGGEVHGG